MNQECPSTSAVTKDKSPVSRMSVSLSLITYFLNMNLKYWIWNKPLDVLDLHPRNSLQWLSHDPLVWFWYLFLVADFPHSHHFLHRQNTLIQHFHNGWSILCIAGWERVFFEHAVVKLRFWKETWWFDCILWMPWARPKCQNISFSTQFYLKMSQT